AAMILTYLLSRSQSEAAPAPATPPAIANPPGLIAFYPRVVARVAKPPAEKSLRVLLEWKHGDGSHVTFVSPGKRLSILAVLTREKFKKPDQALYLSPRYVVAKDMTAVQEGREPLVRATAGEVMDWAYVYDRNGDGRADYLCYLVGPMPVEGDSFPADFPVESQALDHQRLDFMLDRTRYIFSHAADEDFDGRVDAIVLHVRDPDRPWVKEFAAILADGGAEPDSSWTFRDAIASPTGAPKRVKGGFVRHRAKGKDVLVTASNFAGWTQVLGKINAAAEATKARIPLAP
ncbi:MAG: hypothetical protein AABZ94_08670, partial [Candidatus Eisenbacteria bacterium]